MSYNDEAYAGIIKNRADRLKQIRKFLKLSRPALSTLSGLPADTLRNWEQARHGGLTEKGARRLLVTFKELGVFCTVEWLLYGIGLNPITPISQSQGGTTILSEEEIVQKELDFFQKLNPNSLYTIVNDDNMLPCFRPGDYVAGRCHYELNIQDNPNFPCLIKIVQGDILLRMVSPGEREGFYRLSYINPKMQTAELLIKSTELICIAPVLWLRRKTCHT